MILLCRWEEEFLSGIPLPFGQIGVIGPDGGHVFHDSEDARLDSDLIGVHYYGKWSRKQLSQ